MKKLFFACFFALVLSVLPLYAVYAYEDTNVTSDGFIYRYYDEDSIEIVGYDGIAQLSFLVKLSHCRF